MQIPAFCFVFTTKTIAMLGALIGFGLLIAVHECGHFLFAKLFGIHAPTFSIGFGPRLIERKIGETNFQLALIPFGGFVEIAGYTASATATDIGEHREFHTKPYWQKLLVMLGGIIFNLLFAYFVYLGLLMAGKPSYRYQSILVKELIKDSPAEHSGILVGDQILGVDEHRLKDEPSFSFEQYLREHPETTVPFIVKRNNTEIIISVALGSRAVGGKMIGSLGIMYAPETIPYIEKGIPFLKAAKEGAMMTWHQVQGIWSAISSMFSQRSLKGAGGPVMIFSESFRMAEQGFKTLLLFLAFISINLAVLNVLPLGALDGGQLLFVTVEWIIRRPLPDMFKIGVNLISWILFIAVGLLLTYRDLIALLIRR